MRAVCLLIGIFLAFPAASRAENLSAKEHYKRGVSLYALQRFSDAALEYEAAFELQPDPALLYNAAQAHRLGGNKQRALALYQSFVRMFPGKDDGTVVRHIAALKAAIEAEGTAQQNPPTATRPVDVKPETPETKPAPPAAVVQVVQPAPSKPPPKKRTPIWVWGVVAGAVAAVGIGLGVGLGVGLSGNEYPSASLGGQRIP